MALHRTALQAAPPGAVIALGDGRQRVDAPADAVSGGGAVPGGAGPLDADGIPLLQGRGLVGGAPAAYVCRGFTCRAPVTDPEDLRAALMAPS
jgi:uncharacterized protein YyaL (SSP411 family)